MCVPGCACVDQVIKYQAREVGGLSAMGLTQHGQANFKQAVAVYKKVP